MEQLAASPATINMLTATQTDGPAFNTRSCPKQDSIVINPMTPPDITPDISSDTSPTPKSHTADRLEALLQMQKTDPFCKCISKCLFNGKVPQQRYLKMHCKLHAFQQGECKIQHYPLQMTEIPDRPFDKIAIDLVTECKTSTSGNKHILTIIDLLTGWPEAYPIPDKTADAKVSTFINEYLPVHMCPCYILSDNRTQFKNSLLDQVLKQLGIDRLFSCTKPSTE